MNPIKAQKIARELMKEHLKPFVGTNYKFRFNFSLKSYGRINFQKETIYLSFFLTLFKNEEHIRDTIIHEIAHLWMPEEGHNEHWEDIFFHLGGKNKN